MTPTVEMIKKVINTLVKKNYPEIIRVEVKLDEYPIVNIYFDYLKWWEKNGEGYGPDDYHVIEKLEDSIEYTVKDALKYIGINHSIVNVMEDDEISSNND